MSTPIDKFVPNLTIFLQFPSLSFDKKCWVTDKKLDGVGPIDNRPLYPIKKNLHMTHDM